MELKELAINDRVRCRITGRNGCWKDEYAGTIVGFTDAGKVKVEGRASRGLLRVRVHSPKNIIKKLEN